MMEDDAIADWATYVGTPSGYTHLLDLPDYLDNENPRNSGPKPAQRATGTARVGKSTSVRR